jgi:type IV secretory pathway TrbD component
MPKQPERLAEPPALRLAFGGKRHPRAVAIVNATLAAAGGLGLRLWIAGAAIWLIGRLAAVWAAKRDPAFVDVVRRHLRHPAHLVA